MKTICGYTISELDAIYNKIQKDDPIPQPTTSKRCREIQEIAKNPNKAIIQYKDGYLIINRKK